MCSVRCSRGFTLIELLVTIGIIGIVTGTAFLNYVNFGTKSLLRTRVAELGEYVRYAQDLSGSAEIFSSSDSDAFRGFQVVRVKVRDGLLDTFRLEKAPGLFADGGFSDTSVFVPGRDADLTDLEFVTLESSEKYYIDVCFIDEDASSPYVRENMSLDSGDCVLCSSPDPAGDSFDAVAIMRNNFDVHFSIEQPTREVHANVIPVDVSNGAEVYVYSETKPEGPALRISDTYEGIRIIFITKLGDRRGIDVYRTGLIKFNPDVTVTCGGEDTETVDPVVEPPVTVTCPVATVTWGGSDGTSCSAITDSVSVGSHPVTNTTEGFVGSATFLCNNDGSWGGRPQVGATCSEDVPDPCGSATVAWTVGGTTCTGTVSSVPAGSPGDTEDAVGPYVGEATFTCENTSEWSDNPLGGATCGLIECSADVVRTWNVGVHGCSGVTEENPARSSYAVDNTNEGLVGSAFFACNDDGTWGVTADSDFAIACDLPATEPCPGEIRSWTVGDNTCTGTLPETDPGSSGLAEDAVGTLTGTASYACSDDGTWDTTTSPSSPACDCDSDLAEDPDAETIYEELQQQSGFRYAARVTTGAAGTADSSGRQQVYRRDTSGTFHEEAGEFPDISRLRVSGSTRTSPIITINKTNGLGYANYSSLNVNNHFWIINVSDKNFVAIPFAQASRRGGGFMTWNGVSGSDTTPSYIDADLLTITGASALSTDEVILGFLDNTAHDPLACYGVVMGACGTEVDTCAAGTVNTTAVSDTVGHHQWQCDGIGGGFSRVCQQAKQRCSVEADLNHCALPESGSSVALVSGTCTAGYAGSCSYTCNDGVWTESSNGCTAISTVTVADGSSCLHDLGALTSESITSVSGNWILTQSLSCTINGLFGYNFARFYTFTLSESSNVTIDLISAHNNYLTLYSGEHDGSSNSGTRLTGNDDGGSGTNAQIVTTEGALSADTTYTVEATALLSGSLTTFDDGTAFELRIFPSD